MRVWAVAAVAAVAAAALAATACGRIGFDDLAARSHGDGGGPADSHVTGDGGSGSLVSTTLHLDRVDPGETLAGFPLLVVLDDSRADRTRFASDASDVQFLDDAGAVLPREIEQVGAPGGPPLVAWVRVPAITGLTTTLTLQYGAPPASVNPSSPWDDHYAAVWHFAAGGSALDSKGHLDLTAIGTTVAAGMFGNGRSLTGTDYLVIEDSSSLAPQTFTISAWANFPVLPVQTAYYAMVSREVADTSDDDLYLGIFGSTGLVTCENANTEYDAAGGNVTAGAWTHYTGTFDGQTERLYLNGGPVGMVTVPGALQTDPRPLFVGADRDGGSVVGKPDADYLQGTIDEVRIELVARDANWILYEDRAMRDGVITY